ncbi:MAG: replication restart DNA helicase PriA [Elainellaceae cyanobacterium]
MRTIQKTVQAIRCPNCGRLAERHYLIEDALVRTQCHGCDYLMVTCSRTGHVVEAYAPGIPAL